MEKGNTAEIPGLGAGEYQAEFYDTKTGKITEKSAITAAGETLTLLLPGFSGDLAVKLKPKEKDTLWKSIDFPRPKKSSRTEFLQDGAILSAGGAGFCGEKEEYRFVYQQASGDFRLSAEIRSLTNLGERVAAGLMVRDSLEPESGYIAVLLHPYSKAQVIIRRDGNTEILKEFDAGERPCFGLNRAAGVLTVRLAKQGREWEPVFQIQVSKEKELLVGLTAASSHTITYITAEFHQLRLAKIEEEIL